MKTLSVPANLLLCFLLSACGGGIVSKRPLGANPDLTSSGGTIDDQIISPKSIKPGEKNSTKPSTPSVSAPTAPKVEALPSSKPTEPAKKADITDLPGLVQQAKNLVKQVFNPSTLAPGSRPEDFIPRGLLTPTVYYKPIFDEDQKKCSDSEKVNLHTTNDVVLTQLCPQTKAACTMQGSCLVKQNGELTSYNYIAMAKGDPHFSKVDTSICPFGLGVGDACLDPFYNVAADLHFFKAGDVIFVPALVGVNLPSGAKHNGFLIVRDSGNRIQGDGRFDFFSGFYNWLDARNPFAKLHLTDQSTKLPYYLVKGETALKVKVDRNYPGLPH